MRRKRLLLGRRLTGLRPPSAFEALRAGAVGFLVKDTEPADLVAGVPVVTAAAPV